MIDTQTRPSAVAALFQGRVQDDPDAAAWLDAQAAWLDAQAAWLDAKRRRSGGDNTARAYGIALRQFLTYCGVPPWLVVSAHAQAWARHLAATVSPATLGLKLAALSGFYDYVQRHHLLPTPDGRGRTLWPADRSNPFAAVQRPKVSPYARASFPTTEELQAILHQPNTGCRTGARDFALLFAIATTCRRCTEILHLRWGDLQPLPNGDCAFTYRYKGGDVRRAVLGREAYRAVCDYLRADGRPPEAMRPGDYLFIPLQPGCIARINPAASLEPNRPLSGHQANVILKKHARRAGVPLHKAHIHALRHAGARLRVEQMERAHNVNVREIQALLGHASLAVTDVYLRAVLAAPTDPGASAAAAALLPRGRRGAK
jgi:integrase